MRSAATSSGSASAAVFMIAIRSFNQWLVAFRTTGRTTGESIRRSSPCNLRPGDPRGVHPPPIEPVKQSGELCSGPAHHSLADRRPLERAPLQPLPDQHQARAVIVSVRTPRRKPRRPPTPRPASSTSMSKYLPPLARRRSYAYVAIDRATRFVYLEILPNRRAETAAGFLQRFLDSCPLKVHTILTRQRLRIHRPLRCRQEGQAQGQTLGPAPLRPPLRRPRHHPPPHPTPPPADQRYGRALQPPARRTSGPRAAKPRRPPPPLPRPCRTRCLSPRLRRRLQSHATAMSQLQAPAEHLANLAGHNAKAGVVGIFPNEASITRLVGTLLLEQNDVYGPPPICKNDHAAMETGLAVVYPALSRGDTAAGPDGIRGSATGQMDELAMARIISLASAEPGLTGSPSLCVTLASRRRYRAERRAAYAA